MKKFLSITIALLMLLSCFALGVAAEDAPLTTAPTDAPETEWQQFEQTIMSKVEASGEAFVFVQEGEPLYVGLDTAGNEVKSGALTATLKADWILTDENGESYFAGDGTWRGRASDNSSFIYQYRMAVGAAKVQWTATVGGQYGIYLWVGGDCPEADETKWVKLATYEGEGKGKECAPLAVEADLTQFEGYAEATHLYIKIVDDNYAAGVNDGYGGRIALGLNYPITLSYDVDAPAVEYDLEAAAKAAAQEEAQVVIDQINELTAYSLEDLNDENYQSIFSKIRQARRAYDALSEAALEIANEAGVLATLEAAEALKAEYEAILEAKANEPTEDPADPVDPADPADPADPTEPEQPADKGGLNPVVIAVIAVAVVAVVVIVIVVIKKKK